MIRYASVSELEISSFRVEVTFFDLFQDNRLNYTERKLTILLNHRRFSTPRETFLGSVHDTKPKHSFVHSTEPTKGTDK